MRTLPALVVIVLASQLLGCPPDRGNHPDAIDGGFGVEAVLNYRFYPYSNAYVVYFFLPREDDYGCENSQGYGWNDDDNEYLSAYLYRGTDVEWVGEYPSLYSPECEAYGTYQWADANCVGNVWGTDAEGLPIDSSDISFEITNWSDSDVRGSLRYGDTTETFRATNCGELDSYYYYDGRRMQSPRPDEAGGQVGRPDDDGPRFGLRFK